MALRGRAQPALCSHTLRNPHIPLISASCSLGPLPGTKLVELGRSIHTVGEMVSYGLNVTTLLRKNTRMSTMISPTVPVSPQVTLTARQRACLEQIARRQTSPQRLVRRTKILLAMEAGANHILPNYVVEYGIAHRKPPEVRMCRLSIQSGVGNRPPSTSTPHWPAC
jgi:hypothetical protein